MASTIKVNNIQNQCGANIVNKCSTTITLGASGDNIVLACGATQSGFGRTGTVDWDTTAKTAGFTAVSGNGYFVNTTSGAITVTLPATPSAGDIVALQDYAGTWGVNNVSIGRNGSNIGGAAIDANLSTSNQSITLVYVDATRGWQTVNDSTQSVDGAEYVAATGGTVTCCGDYKIHTFTGPGTFTVTCAGNPVGSTTVDYLVVAGGGGSGSGLGGGGGAGGYRTNFPSPAFAGLPVSVTGYPITIGSGGAGGNPDGGAGNPGSPSIFSTITSTAGGAAVARPAGPSAVGNGGSGGGSAGLSSAPGGAGNTPPVSPPQGNPGGQGTGASLRSGGGGGGAGGGGVNGSSGLYGQGGVGSPNSISGSAIFYAGGGGGNGDSGGPAPSGAGGQGGGGQGGPSPVGTAGSANTGGGAGGGGAGSPNSNSGGSGIVIIRYKFQ